mmetsp:Transcript_15305/g.44453  ORF Transcript_15305/g.44453 Transcript_15305/m.44453 type:complete len:199 (-) Transcript_15305:2381-2977(-)
MTSTTGSTQNFPDGIDPLPTLQLKRHINYFSRCLRKLPGAYTALDTNRLTLVHFAVQSLDLLGALDNSGGNEVINRDAIIEWVYSLYTSGNDETGVGAGFKGGTFLGAPHLATGNMCSDCGTSANDETNQHKWKTQGAEYDCGHVAMTYTALCTLAALGDNLERFQGKAVIKGLKQLQNSDGRCVLCFSSPKGYIKRT